MMEKSKDNFERNSTLNYKNYNNEPIIKYAKSLCQYEVQLSQVLNSFDEIISQVKNSEERPINLNDIILYGRGLTRTTSAHEWHPKEVPFDQSFLPSEQFLEASGLKRNISVEAGQQLEFNWKFLAGDELPFNDTFFTVAGSDIFSVASVYSVGDYGEEEGTFTYVFTESGDYTIGAAVMDGHDSSGDSYLAIDNFRLTGVAQSSNAMQSGFTQIPYELHASDISNLKFDPGLHASDKPFADIKYHVQDSRNAFSDVVTLTIDVEPVNDTPIVTPDSFEFELNEENDVITASGSMLLRSQ